MSYARWGHGGSAVYVFAHAGGGIECCGCLLQNYRWVDDDSAFLGGHLEPVGEIIETRFRSTEAALAHMAAHRAAGHHVPDDVDTRLIEDDEQNFPPRGESETGPHT